VDPAQWKEVEEIFHAADRKPAGERRAFVEERCGGDLELKEEVLSLLGATEEADDFMAKPPLEEKIDLDRATSLFEEEELSFVGKIVGSYRLEKIIASGGMGTVYLAERQDDSFHKRVAVKLIRGGLQSREIVRRFFRERQTLANLDHPNIARLLDGGTSEDNHPYLVMEYIEGAEIDVYCDSRKLSITARLEIFRRVCAAVQFAHGKLIVHRDIKPGNILVTDDGIPKLLDFGIVKVLDPEDASTAKLTLTRQRLMTPEYASPEQVRGDTISTAADIYSLGIVLYELVTGHHPFRFFTTSAQEVERIICEEDPLRPSVIIGEVAETSVGGGEIRTLTPEEVSRPREGRPEKLRRRLAGDLDHVIMKALRKEPEKRYASVEHLSEDIGRHLKGLPVRARKGTWRYRAAKFTRRNRPAAALAVFVFLILLGLSLFALREARRSADQVAAQQVLDFLAHLYEKPFSNRTPREEIRETMAAKKTKELAESLRDQPEELIRYAETLTQICEGYYLEGLAVYWRRVSLQAYKTDRLEVDPALVAPGFYYARALRRAGRFGEAEKQIRKTIDIEQQFPGESGIQPGLSKHLLAGILWDLGDYKRPGPLFEESLGMLKAGDRAPSVETVRVMIDYANYLGDRSDSERVIALLETALSEAGSIRSEQGLLARAEVCQNLGNHLWWSPRFGEAEVCLRKALEIFQSRLSERDPRLSSCMIDLSFLLLHAIREIEEDSFEVATAYWRKAWRNRDKVFGEESLATARSLHVLVPKMTPGSAGRILRRILEKYRSYWPGNHPRLAEAMELLGSCLAGVTSPLARRDQLQESEELLRDALEIQSEHLSPRHWKTAQTEIHMGFVLMKQDRFDESIPLILEGLQKLENRLGANHPVLERYLRLSRVYFEEAELWNEVQFCTDRLKDEAPSWPYGKTFRDCDSTREKWARIDFEDDQIEKRILVDQEIDKASKIHLWIFGRPCNWVWREFRDYENIRIRVNHDPAQEVAFNVALKYAYLTDYFQWVPFEIPAGWLVKGRNTFTIYAIHEPDYDETRPWEHNNFRIGIDCTDSQSQNSWWFGSSEDTCCEEMEREAMDAPKPLSRDAAIIVEHREEGYRECKGELMICLEIN
jgi:eukaryotic-like serine/threonine-protein kinase